MAAAHASYGDALRHRDFRLLSIAQTQSAMGDWAYYVALVVFVYAQTSSAAWVSATMLARLVPRLIASPYAGVIAERFERVRLMIVLDLLRVVAMLGLALVAALDAPVLVAVVLSAISSTVGCAYAPATAAMTPQLLGEEELAAGNALGELINNVAIVAGPAVGALVLAAGQPAVVMAANAVTFAVSALLLSRMEARSVPTDVRQDGGVLAQVAVGVKAVVGSSTAALLTGFTIITTLLYGVDSVLFVTLSRDKLGTGAEGYGYLLVALGVGGILGAGFVNRLEALPRLSVVLSLGMVAYSAPTLVLVWVHEPSVAFVVEVVRGVATLVVDVLAMTALQRSLAPDMIARVFGVFWALITLGAALGTLAAPLMLASMGLDGTLWVDSLLVPVVVLLTFPRLAAVDRSVSDAVTLLAPRVTALQSLDLFAAAPRTALERLARGADEVLATDGTTLIVQGSPADALFVLAEGRVEV
ncbi:MAG: transporter, partial [Frankiales bacterium]|nr:transporter [Frankiales bacterium]